MSTRLDANDAARRKAALHTDWSMDTPATSISRRFTFDTFAAAVQLANLAAWLAEKAEPPPRRRVRLGLLHDYLHLARRWRVVGARLRGAETLDGLVA
jgi:pterin-4a-carbinolamine dehydratase